MKSKLNQTIVENALIGLIIIKPKLISKIIGVLNEENFSDKNISLIYKVVEKLFNNKEKIDPIILSEELSRISKNDKNYWINFIGNLTIESGYESNIDEYVKILVDKKQSKDLEKTLSISLSEVKNEKLSVKELVEKIESDIFSVTRNRELKNFEKIDKLVKKFSNKLDFIKSNGYKDGLQTEILSLDNVMGGLKKSELIIVAARPSMGKTAFALQLINNISKEKNVGLFSLEMPSNLILQRLISLESGLSQDFLRTFDKLPENRVHLIKKSMENIKSRRLWIDDTVGLKISEIVWKIRKLNTLINLDLIVIDYLQLIESDKGNHENRQQIISDISRTLKMVSRELNIPVIVLSQLSRKVESREDKKPMMSDLRESGAIEQDADVILLLYRPNYYKKSEKDHNIVIEDLEVIISKNRNGKTGIVKLDMNMEIGRITTKNYREEF